MTTAILFVNGIGDAILTLPAVRAFVRSIPQTRLLFPDYGAYRAIYSEIECATVPIMARVRNGQWTFDLEQVTDLLYDTHRLILMTTSDTSDTRALSTTLSGQIETFGLYDYYDNFPQLTYPCPIMSRYMALARCCLAGARLEDYSAPMRLDELRPLSPEWDDFVRNHLGAVIIHPDTAPNKTFSIGTWKTIVERLLEDHPCHRFVISGGEDAANLASEINRSRLSSAARSPFEVSMSLIDAAPALIGIDSCLMHFADLQRIPLIQIFRSTSVKDWGAILSKRVFTVHSPLHDPEEERIPDILSSGLSTIAGPRQTGGAGSFFDRSQIQS